MDAIFVARHTKCSEEVDDGNWITGMEEVHFHLRLELRQRPENFA